MIKVIKRDGRCEKLNLEKVYSSIKRAADDIKIDINAYQLSTIGEKALEILLNKSTQEIEIDIDIERMQDAIEKALYVCGHRKIRESYKNYRKERTDIRETKTDIMRVIKKIGVETDRDNANVGNNFSAKLLRIASEANKWQVLANMPKDLAKEHEMLDLYFHDLDSFNLTTNCLHIPLKKTLLKGFNTGYGYIKPPKRLSSAAELACILIQSSQNDLFGGQSYPNFDNDMSYFVNLTREEIKRSFATLSVYEPEEVINARIEARLEKEVKQAMQSIVFNLNSMHSRAGSQIVFSSVNLGLPEDDDAALICKSFLEEYEKGFGNGEAFIFPNIVFRLKKGVNANPEDPYYYLFELACKVAAKRMNPTFMNLDSDFNLEYYNQGYIPATMG